MSLPVVNAIGELKESQKIERQALQKSMRAGLLVVAKSVQSLQQSFNAAFDVQKNMLKAQEAAALAMEERRREDARARKQKDPKEFDAKGLPGAAGKLYAVAVGIFLFARNAFTGILKSLGVDIKKIATAIKYQFSYLRPGIEMIKYLLTDPFIKAGKALSNMKIFKVISTFIGFMNKTFITPVSKFMGDLKSVLAPAISKIGNVIRSVVGSFQAGTQAFGPVTKILGSLGTLVGKLFVPIKAVMAIFEAGKGAMEGFAKEGNFFQKIINGIFGALGGLVGSFIGGIADLAKSGISMIFGALGFDAVEEFLDSFSFEDSIKKIFSFLGDVVSSPIDALSSIIEWAKKFFTFKGLKDAILGGGGLFGGGDEEEEEPEEKKSNAVDKAKKKIDRDREAIKKSKKQKKEEEEPYVFGAGIDGGEEFDENAPVEMPKGKSGTGISAEERRKANEEKRNKRLAEQEAKQAAKSPEEKEARKKANLDSKIRTLSKSTEEREARLAKGEDRVGRKLSERDLKRETANLEKQKKKLEELKSARSAAGGGGGGGAPVVTQVNNSTNSTQSSSQTTVAPANASRAGGQQYKLAGGFG